MAALGVTLGACRDDAEGRPDSPAQPPELRAGEGRAPDVSDFPAESRVVSDSVDAFDLRVYADGAVLVYAGDGPLRLVHLDRRGALMGDVIRVAAVSGQVRALLAGVSAGRAAVAWLRREGAQVYVEVALGAGRPLAFGPALELESWSASAEEHALGERELALRCAWGPRAYAPSPSVRSSRRAATRPAPRCGQAR